MSNTSHWEQVCELVGLALETTPAERDRFLAASPFPQDVRDEAASLLESHGDAGQEDFLAGDAVSSGLASVEIVRSPWINRTVGPYRILEEIGHGGMGVVLLAARADDLYERQVAIKVVRADLAGELFLRRFRKEIRILAGFDHPAIARLLDAGVTEDGYPFLVMEYVRGVPIDQFCREQVCDVARTLSLVSEVVAAVSYAHELHVVHRDIKPGNILVTAEGRPKLLDFGIAKLLSDMPDEGYAQTELRAWTPAYASPEQLAGGNITHQSDVYSLGALLYRLLTGSPPFDFAGLSPLEIERTFETTRPVAPSCVRVGAGRPRPLLASTDPVVLKALETRPQDRYGSALELSADLGRLLRGEPPLARIAGPFERAGRWVRRRRRSVATAGIAAAVLCAALVAWHRDRLTPAHAAISSVSLRPSVAVLPFRNIGRSHEEDWVSAAASEVLSTELAAGDRIRVARSEDVSQAERDLRLSAAGSDLPASALSKLARNIDSRYVVSGSYLPEGAVDEPSHLRFDVALFDAETQHILSKHSFRGSAQQISSVAGEISQSLLAGIGVDPQGAASEAERMLPQEPEAVRWYAEGRRHLREMDYVAARTAFEHARGIEEGSALIHSALAEALEGLGYSKLAEIEASRAVQLSATLPKRARLTVEGGYRELQNDWPHAVAIYSTLHEFFPDDLDYGLHLARDQAAARQPDQALATIAELERLPPPLNGDPRIPLAGASIAERASRIKTETAYAEKAFNLAQERGATQETAQALLEQASALRHAGHYFEAVKLGRQAEQCFAHSGDLRGQATALNAIGNFQDSLGNFDAATEAYTGASELFKRVGYIRGWARSLNGLGNIADSRNDKHKALALYEQSLALNRQLDEPRLIAVNLNNVANVQRELYHTEQARALYLESYKLYESIQDRGGVAQVKGNLATLLRNEGRLSEARRSNEEELAIYTELGIARSMVWPMQGLAHTALLEGDLPRAKHWYQQAIASARAQGNQEQAAYALCNISEVLGLMGERDEQRKATDESIRIRQSMGLFEDSVECRLMRIRQDLREARLGDLNRQVTEILAALGKDADPALVAEAHLVDAQLSVREDRLDAAAAALLKARSLLAGTPQAVEARWEADITASQLAARLGSGAQRSSEPALRADVREATRLHNRPWCLRLELAEAASRTRRSGADAEAMLQHSLAEAHAMHAEGLVEIARADLRPRHVF